MARTEADERGDSAAGGGASDANRGGGDYEKRGEEKMREKKRKKRRRIKTNYNKTSNRNVPQCKQSQDVELTIAAGELLRRRRSAGWED